MLVLRLQKALVKWAQNTTDGDDALYLQASLVAVENMRAAHVLKSFTRERIFKVCISNRCRWNRS